MEKLALAGGDLNKLAQESDDTRERRKEKDRVSHRIKRLFETEKQYVERLLSVKSFRDENKDKLNLKRKVQYFTLGLALRIQHS